MADPIPAIGYIRVSMKREEMLSPQLQRTSIEQWARVNGRRVADSDWVIDLDATGRNFVRKVKGAIERVVQGDVGEIIVYRYDRWGRNARDALANVVRVETAGGALISATEPLDAETAIGRYNRTNAFALAEMQSDIIGENWRGVREHRIREQLHPYGRKRFGYTRLGRIPDEDDPQRTRKEKGATERYVPDPETGPVLAGMYADYIRGDGGRTIARSLNDRAVPTVRGRPWSGRTVLDTLDSGFGAGYLRLHDPSCRCAGPQRCPNRVWVKGSHETVILDDQWQAYRQRRAETLTIPPRHRTPVYPLSGLVRCGHCRAAMTGVRLSTRRNRPSEVQFRCGRHRHYADCPGHPAVALTVLLEAVRAQIAEIADDLDAAAAVTKARTVKAKDARGLAERLGRDLAAADRKLVRLALLRAQDEDSDLPPSSWLAAAAEVKRDRARIEQQLAVASRESAAASADPLPVVTGVLQGWDTLPPARLNQLLRLLIRQVTVWRTGDPARDSRGHWLPQPVRVKVIPIWQHNA